MNDTKHSEISFEELGKINSLIQKSAAYLDSEKFVDWLGMFERSGVYEVHTYSPEIKKNMVWMSYSRDQMETLLLKELPNHLREDAKRAHIVSVQDVQRGDEGISALSRFMVCKTSSKGETSLYATGTYTDLIDRAAEGGYLIARRKVALDTRMFDVFPHIIPL